MKPKNDSDANMYKKLMKTPRKYNTNFINFIINISHFSDALLTN